MLDTGATTIAIPGDTAARLDLAVGRRFRTQTANGTAEAFATTLDSVSIGEISLNDVEAAISPGLGTEEILLGMSFLQNIEFTQRGDTLILRQYADRNQR
jgi:aspartyl protease family protein